MIKYLFRQLQWMFYYRDTAKLAKKLGVSVGVEVKILGNPYRIFGSEPWLVSIGDHVEITNGCRFLTHDGGAWVFRKEYPSYDVFGPITVGNNVFVGTDSTILPGVKIGDNCVIGARSVVTKDVASNTVVAGCPAKFIKTVEEYKSKIEASAVPTHAMSIGEKQVYLRENRSGWFK